MPAKLFLITGIPGTGKTSIGHYLAAHHGYVHFDAEAHAASRSITNEGQWIDLWDDFVRLVDGPRADGSNVVITWGFMPGLDDGTVRRLQELGFKMIWFDGDRVAARREFLRRGTVSADLLEGQMARIGTLNLNAFHPVPFDPFDEHGQFLSKATIAERLLALD